MPETGAVEVVPGSGQVCGRSGCKSDLPHTPTPSPSERPVLRSRTPEGAWHSRVSRALQGGRSPGPKVKVLWTWARTEADPGRP